MKLPQLMRLKESRRVPMWNGPIECRLFRFDMVAGSHKKDVVMVQPLKIEFVSDVVCPWVRRSACTLRWNVRSRR